MTKNDQQNLETVTEECNEWYQEHKRPEEKNAIQISGNSNETAATDSSESYDDLWSMNSHHYPVPWWYPTKTWEKA